MKIIKDTQLMNDPNEFGEALRDYCFVPDGVGWGNYGCYSTFELRPEFKKLLNNSGIRQRLSKLSGWSGSDGRVNFYCYSNGNIHLGWWWDGDGTLIIQEGNKITINNDCKCDYTWEWVDNDTNN